MMRHEIPARFKRGAVAVLNLAWLCLLCGCPRKAGPPVLQGGQFSDFNAAFESFLEEVPGPEHAAIIHAVLFLVEGEMDPAAYAGKALGDLLKLPVPEVLKFELYGRTGEDILQFARQRFLEKRAALEVERTEVQDRVEALHRELKKQAQQAELLAGLLVRDSSVRYEQGPFEVRAYLDFRVANQSTATLKGLVFRIEFKGLADGIPSASVDKRETFSEPLLPGGSRPFKLLASECPKILNKTPADYPQLLQATVQVVNASLPSGESLLAAIPDTRLEKKVQAAQARLAEIQRLHEVSSSGEDFLFWGRNPADSS